MDPRLDSIKERSKSFGELLRFRSLARNDGIEDSDMFAEDGPVPFGRPRDPSMKQRAEFHELQQHVLSCLRRSSGPGQVRVSV